jgi:hypothetical protein
MEYFTSAGDSWHGYRERSFLLETPSGVVECSLRLWESPKDPGQVSRESRKYRSDHEAFCSSIRIE